MPFTLHTETKCIISQLLPDSESKTGFFTQWGKDTGTKQIRGRIRNPGLKGKSDLHRRLEKLCWDMELPVRLKKQTNLKHTRRTNHKMCSLKRAEKHTIQRVCEVTFWRYWNAHSVFEMDPEGRESCLNFFLPSYTLQAGMTLQAQGYSLLSLFNFLRPPCTVIWRLRLMLCVPLLGQDCRDCRTMTAFGRGPERKIYLLPCRCLVRLAAASPHPL